MTLIVAAVNAEAAVIAADTRLSWNGSVRDDKSAKIGGVTLYDGRLIYAYTGLASWGRFRTREWLLESLVKNVKPWYGANEALLALKKFANAEFDKLADLRTAPSVHRRLTVVFAGFVAAQPVAAILSNFENYAGNQRFSEAQSQFWLSCWSPTPTQMSWSACFGQEHLVPAEEKQQLADLVAHKKPLAAIRGKAQAAIVRAFEHPQNSGAVGANILSAMLPADPSGGQSSFFTSEKGGDEILASDMFNPFVLGGSAVMGLTLSAPGIVEPRSMRRGRGGRYDARPK